MHGTLKKVYKCISEKGSCAFYSYYCLVLTLSFIFSELRLLIFFLHNFCIQVIVQLFKMGS